MLDSVVSLLSVLLFSSFKCNKTINRCRLSHKKSNECILMGNGPSLSTFLENMDEEENGKEVFAINFFCSTDYFDKVKPSYYALLDPLIFEQSSTLAPKVQELIIKFNDIFWQMVLFVPSDFRKSFLVKRLNNENLTIVPFNPIPIKGFSGLENFIFRMNLGMPVPETVINAAIFIAINMKFERIHLYGVEQSWLKHLHVSNENEVRVGLPHFYRGSDNTRENRTLSEFLLSQASVFSSHMRLQKYAKAQGSHILNHTPNSYIDAYERAIE